MENKNVVSEVVGKVSGTGAVVNDVRSNKGLLIGGGLALTGIATGVFVKFVKPKLDKRPKKVKSKKAKAKVVKPKTRKTTKKSTKTEE